ncbi:MAG: M48 family metalloprotease [Acidobacteria bacterium]|nr:M48 family metalloprotease [Acidobacteriota bacterium]
MRRRSFRPVFTIFVAFLILNMLAPVTLAGIQDKSKDKKREEKEKEKQAKQEREYQKIKNYSLEKYQKDPGFHDAVEQTFSQKQREHSEYAFYINTRDAQDTQITRTGDKLKIEDLLYDNPMFQDYINRVGHSVAPKESKKYYAFKVTLNPIPEARSLSTGTIFISTGLLSSVDNEAQLAYILGHEIAHIEKEHWREDVLVQLGMDDYNEKQQRKRNLLGGLAQTAAGMLTGGLARSSGAGLFAAYLANAELPTILKVVIPNSVFSWDKQQEDEADQLALDYMFNRNYDPREVPKFYANLQHKSQRDRRVEGGFMANAERIYERYQKVDEAVGGLAPLIATRSLSYGAYNFQAHRAAAQQTAEIQQQINAAQADLQRKISEKPADPGKQLDPTRNATQRAQTAEQTIGGRFATELKAKLDLGEIVGTTEDFSEMMAELRRDNGIRAYYYDMFQMAQDNLQESLLINSNDPQAHLYYGKLLKLVARTPAEKSQALAEFVKAIELDKRRVIPESHLHKALAMMENKDASQAREIADSLKQYVIIYQQENRGALPQNIEIIYDYLDSIGDKNWVSRPAMNVATKGLEPLTTTPSGRQVEASVSTPVTSPGQGTTAPGGRSPRKP